MVAARTGLVVKQRSSPIVGSIVGVANGRVVLRDRRGLEHRLALLQGGFELDGEIVTLVEPRTSDLPRQPPARTASGSIAVPDQSARIARASRILVEGLHDAELVEKVWGDDLRVEGVVVEMLDGADHLEAVVRSFRPGPGRRLGVLLDHLVDGSKESRLARHLDHPDLLITGHPFVDIWEAVRPSVAGIDAWPVVPRGEDWKQGVLDRLGVDAAPGRFWRSLLGRVGSWTDLEPALIGAVEQLIDFVTEPPRT